MSARTDIVREALLGEFDAQAVLDGSTPDVTLYAPGIGADVKGRDEVADVLAKFFAAAKPTYRLEIDPVEQGDVVVAFAAAEIGGKQELTRHPIDLRDEGRRGADVTADRGLHRVLQREVGRRGAARDVDVPVVVLGLI